MYFVNERFHNKALTGIVVSVSCSCALNLLNFCTFTLHIRQILATFPVIQFALQLVPLVNKKNYVSVYPLYTVQHLFQY